MSTRRIVAPIHPALVAHAEARATDIQNRIADSITRFAGSMPFVYVHLIWFSIWIASGIEAFPFGFLTMIVSLEAIFLSTFVMISQNRADQKREALANHQWEMIQLEKKQNEELLEIVVTEKKQNDDLLDLSRQILHLTSEVRDLAGKISSTN
jgi:uncharacterized membrane protein